MIIFNLKRRIYTKINTNWVKFKNYIKLIIEEIFAYFFLLFYKKYSNSDIHIKKTILLCRFNNYGNKNDVSTEKIHLDDTLFNYEAKVIVFYWDSISRIGTNLINLIKISIELKPELIIFSSYSNRIKRPITQPSSFILRILKNKNLVNSIIAIWWDTCSDKFTKMYFSKQTIFDLHIIVDNPTLNLDYNSINKYEIDKIIALYPPYNINSYFYPLNKDINYSFLGQIDSYRSYRKEYITFLDNCNIKGLLKFDNRTTQITHKEYCEILGRSKIGINFSFSVDKHQIKGRVFEFIMSGALLLESKNDQIEKLFDENIEYVSFNTKEEMYEKIKYYLEHETERAVIVKNAIDKINLKYNGTLFWQTIFNKLNLDICLK